MDKNVFMELISDIQKSAEEVVTLAKNSEVETEAFTEFSVFVEKLGLVLGDLKHNKLVHSPAIRKSVKSLHTELQRAKALILCPNCRSPTRLIEDMAHDLGRSLGLVLFSSHGLSIVGKERIDSLRREMMNARFDSNSVDESDFLNDDEIDELENYTEEEEEIVLDINDLVYQLKCGNDDDFACALFSLKELIRERTVTSEWIDDEGIIPILFNRLNSIKKDNSLTIIQIFRSLASECDDNKEKMADVVSLTTLVKSLTRAVEEQREAVGLLSSLSDLTAVRRRIGRIQGCIVMLVDIFNGDDTVASRNAEKLLNSLSSNTQNALHMAEAGYFKPLVHYLKQGSEMSRILMATALSRMKLTDQRKASLGEVGAIGPLVEMFNTGKLEAKLSALSALQNLSSLKENIQQLIDTGIIVNLLQLLFSVTSVLMTLREPAAAILSKIAQSESVLVNQGIAQQMLSLLNLCSPVIQYHLLQALNSIAAHSRATKVRRKMKRNGAIQLLLPFLAEANAKIRTSALNLIYTISKDLNEDLMEELGETHVRAIVSIISSSISEGEKAAAVGILSNIPISDKKATEILKMVELLPLLISLITTTSTPMASWLAESITGVLIRFTLPSDKKLQQFSAEQGLIPALVKLLSTGSAVAKCRAAISLGHLSRNSLALSKSRASRWHCIPPSKDALCEVHGGYCSIKSTFCLVVAGAIPPILTILEGTERETDEAVLGALASLVQDEIWENGSKYIAKISGVKGIINVLEFGSLKAQEKALWILDRIFRVEDYRVEYGEFAQVVLIDLAHNGNPQLKPTIAKILAQLELLQFQSSYF